MSELERITTQNCPFTNRPYDCGKCKVHEGLEIAKGVPCGLHFTLCFDGYLADGKRGLRHLHALVGGKRACTLDECADYFWELHRNGATCVPVGECDRFCYRKGCMGHVRETKGGEA